MPDQFLQHDDEAEATMGAEVEAVMRRIQQGSVAAGEAMMNVAMGLMREVRDEVKGVRKQLDDIAKERREEAYEQGATEARLKALEDFRQAQLDAARANRRMAVGALMAAAGTLLLVIMKLVIMHPESMPK